MKGLYCKKGDQGDVKFVLQETNVPNNLGSHQVKVQVKSCALSPVDFKLYEDLKFEKEHVPVGREIAGVVLQVDPKLPFSSQMMRLLGFFLWMLNSLAFAPSWLLTNII
ncbi:hypothetical protein cypCar_00008697 [Cyprinus carpio]|nr:hypothetical protein cypCar_00008697 [Cyprinus carpio]